MTTYAFCMLFTNVVLDHVAWGEQNVIKFLAAQDLKQLALCEVRCPDLRHVNRIVRDSPKSGREYPLAM